MDVHPGKLDELRFDAVHFQFPENIAEQDGGVSALAGAAVNGENLDAGVRHSEYPHFSPYFSSRAVWMAKNPWEHSIVYFRPGPLAVWYITFVRAA
jgi:hypothetical protein